MIWLLQQKKSSVSLWISQVGFLFCKPINCANSIIANKFEITDILFLVLFFSLVQICSLGASKMIEKLELHSHFDCFSRRFNSKRLHNHIYLCLCFVLFIQVSRAFNSLVQIDVWICLIAMSKCVCVCSLNLRLTIINQKQIERIRKLEANFHSLHIFETPDTRQR